MIKMLNVTEFAEILQVKEQTVYAWVHYKQLPKEIYRKLGRKTRFIEDEVDKWILNGASLLPPVKRQNPVNKLKGEEDVVTPPE